MDRVLLYPEVDVCPVLVLVTITGRESSVVWALKLKFTAKIYLVIKRSLAQSFHGKLQMVSKI